MSDELFKARDAIARASNAAPTARFLSENIRAKISDGARVIVPHRSNVKGGIYVDKAKSHDCAGEG